MTNLHNVVVFIKDEAELEEAREMLLANWEMIDTFFLNLSNNEKLNYLQFYDYWFLSCKHTSDIQINLTELEQLIKKEKEDENK